MDWSRLLKNFLNHDVVEAMTGDIISTVKHKNEQLRDMLGMLEKEIVEKTCLRAWRNRTKASTILFDGKDNTLEGKYSGAPIISMPSWNASMR